jgi:hypothetical protein
MAATKKVKNETTKTSTNGSPENGKTVKEVLATSRKISVDDFINRNGGISVRDQKVMKKHYKGLQKTSQEWKQFLTKNFTIQK